MAQMSGLHNDPLYSGMIEQLEKAKKFKSRITGEEITIPDSTIGYNTDYYEEERKISVEKLYDLEINDSTIINGHEVTRVPGGWIYDRSNGSVFVPFNDEGQQEQLKL